MHSWGFSTLQRAVVLLCEAEMLLIQPLKRLMLSDLHTCAHVAVAVHEKCECTRQVLAAGWVKDKKGFL